MLFFGQLSTYCNPWRCGQCQGWHARAVQRLTKLILRWATQFPVPVLYLVLNRGEYPNPHPRGPGKLRSPKAARNYNRVFEYWERSRTGGQKRGKGQNASLATTKLGQAYRCSAWSFRISGLSTEPWFSSDLLVSKAQTKMKDRCSPVLKSFDVEIVLEHGLSPAVREICEKGDLGFERYIIIARDMIMPVDTVML